MKTKPQPATFPTRAAAKSIIADLDSRQYILAHGEHSRPDYIARKCRNSPEFYIYARRHYYAGTLGPKPSGPLTHQDPELYRFQP